MTKGFLFFASMILVIAACTTSKVPTAPTSAQSGMSVPLAHLGHGAALSDAAAADPANSAAHEDKGYIDGWFNGEDAQLYYTKSFFCDPLPRTAGGGWDITTTSKYLQSTPVRLARALEKLEGNVFAQDSHKVTSETEQAPSKVTPENPSNLLN